MKQYGLLFIVLIIFSIAVTADTEPKPNADIRLTFEGNQIPDDLFSAALLHCIPTLESIANTSVENCMASQLITTGCVPLAQFVEYDANKKCYWVRDPLVSGGDCVLGACKFNYSLPDPFRLAVHLPSTNKTYISNAISRKNVISEYNANIQSEGTITIKEIIFEPVRSKNDRLFVLALLLTLFFELLTYFIYVQWKKAKGIHLSTAKLLISVLCVNIATSPLLWRSIGWTLLIIAEIGIIIVEAAVIFFVMKKDMSLRTVMLLSAIANAASFILGGVILFFFPWFL